jgi:hypothetical protein
MSKKFCIYSGSNSVGATFFDWSVLWLSGATKHYWTKIGQKQPGIPGWRELTPAPLTDVNSHGYAKNNPCGSAEVQECIDVLDSLNTEDLTSFFPMHINADDALLKLGINLPVNNVKHDMDKYYSDIFDYQQQDCVGMWQLCQENQIPILYLKLTNPIMYKDFSRSKNLRRWLLPGEVNHDEFDHDYMTTFFSKSLDQWKQGSMEFHRWDRREFLALNLRPWEEKLMEGKVDFTIPHLYLDAQELWYDGLNTMIKTLDYLGLKLDDSRLDHWNNVYTEWQQIQFVHLAFTWNFDHIIECIINGRSHDLSRYKLSLVKEAMMQHALIYKHGLTLKGWGLENFPDDTKDLHQLLEPNVYHDVEDLYNCLKR